MDGLLIMADDNDPLGEMDLAEIFLQLDAEADRLVIIDFRRQFFCSSSCAWCSISSACRNISG